MRPKNPSRAQRSGSARERRRDGVSKLWPKAEANDTKSTPTKSVLIAVRVHPFPSRTRQLSSLAPKILGWQRPGKIGSADTKKRTVERLSASILIMQQRNKSGFDATELREYRPSDLQLQWLHHSPA